MHPKKGFTLVEVVITIIIMGLLIGLIFEIFVTIGRITVFVQLNRTMHAEMIYFVQTIQNMIDDQTMNLTGLDLSEGGDSQSAGWKNSLLLADDVYMYQLTNICADELCTVSLNRQDINITQGIGTTGSVQLINSGLITVESFAVRTLPYTSPIIYTGLVHEGFWIFAELRVNQYTEDKWWLRVKQYMQLFFSLRKYE